MFELKCKSVHFMLHFSLLVYDMRRWNVYPFPIKLMKLEFAGYKLSN